MENIQNIIHKALNTTGEQRGHWVNLLYDYVKKYECEDGEWLKPVEEALPFLAEYLLIDDEWNVNGCTLSIFRRVHINTNTIDKLLDLSKSSTNDSTFIYVLSYVDAGDWKIEIEDECLRVMQFDPGASSRMFYVKAYFLQRKETVEALGAIALSGNVQIASMAINALSSLTKFQLTELALAKLEQIFPLLHPKVQLHATQTFGWATNNALKLLELSSTHDSPEIRLATVEALKRTYLNQQEAKNFLHILSTDRNEKVAKAADQDSLEY